MARKHLSPLNLVNLTSDPGTATEGDFYWNSSTNKLRVYYDGAWADATQAASVYQFSTTPPSSPTAGDYWIDSTTGSGYVYVSDGDSSQWVDLESNGYIGSSISLTSSNPEALGSVAVGTASNAARADHVHPTTGLVTTSSLGSGVSTALSSAVGTSGAFVVNGGALGAPSSGTLTNATGLPISTGVSGLGSGIATFLATPSSSNLISAMSDETGSGLLVFATSPTLTTPLIANSSGTAASGLVDYNGDVFTATTSNTSAGKGLLQAPYIVISNANSTATTSTTAQSIFQSGSRTIPLEAGKSYYFRANLYGTSTFTSGTANIQLVPVWSNTQQNYRYNVAYTASAGTAAYAAQTSGTTTATPTQNSTSITATTNFIITVEGTFLANATTGGTFELQARMSTTGSSTVFNTGSMLQVQKIGTAVNGEIAGVWA